MVKKNNTHLYWEEIIAIYLFILMLIILVWQIISRPLGIASPWTTELALTLFIYVSVFGSSGIYLRKMHVRIEYFEQKIPQKIKLIIHFIIIALIIATLCLVLIKGIQVVMRKSYLPLVTLKISKAYMYASLPIFAVLMLIRIIQGLVQNIRELQEYQKNKLSSNI